MDEAQGMSQSQDTSSPGTTSQPAPEVQTPAPQEEKVFRQSEVNSLVGREKARAVEDYKRAQTQQPNYGQQRNNDAIEQQRSHQQPYSASEQDIRRLASEEFKRSRDEWIQDARTKSDAEQAENTVKNFWSKIAPGKEKYQDFEKVTPSVEVLMSYPNVVQLIANHVDNAHDVYYMLGQDLTKMELIESMAQRNTQAAIQQMRRMSQSIKDNEAAGRSRIPNEPLSQMRPSNTGTDNGVMSVKDYRAKWKV